MRRYLPGLLIFWGCVALLGWWFLGVSSPEPQHSIETTPPATEQINAAQSSIPVEHEEISRVEVPLSTDPGVALDDTLISPIEALKAYAIDMRTSTLEQRSGWFAASAKTLNHPEFSTTFQKRWGYPLDTKFHEDRLAYFELYTSWHERATRMNLDLLGTLLALFREEQHVDLWEHWMKFFSMHRQPNELRLVISELRLYIATYPRTEPDYSKRVTAILQALMLVSALEGNASIDMLELLADPATGEAVGDAGGFMQLTQIAALVDYAKVADRIPALLRHPSAEVQWGAVEMLRHYVARKQLNGEALVAMLPDSLLRTAKDSRCAAALELLTRYGGQNGLERMLALVNDTESPRRGAALETLASQNKVSLSAVLGYNGDVGLRRSVLRSLIILGVNGDNEVLPHIRNFLSDANTKVQEEAATWLYSIGELSIEEARHYGARLSQQRG